MTDLPDDAIAKLYAVPLSAFTRERDALASALTNDKRATEARAVRQLRRPSGPLWATNQLAHAERDRLDAFLDGIAQVRKTQLCEPRAAAEGLARQRRELQTLVRRAGELLARHGTRATPDAMRRISDTLLGAAVDSQRANELRHGRLTQELDAPGFEVLTGGGRAGHLQLVKGGKAASPDAGRAQRNPVARREHVTPQKDEAARQRRNAARERAEAAARDREAAAERKRQDAEARQREMAERRAAVEQADQEAKELKARLAAARQRLAEARRAAKSPSRRRPTS